MADLFFNLATQWRRHGFTGVRVGLDYSVVPAVAGMMGLAMTPRVLAGLRIMEDEALIRFAART